MADINIRRRRASAWPWVVGLLVMALLVWALVELLDRNEPDVAGPLESEERLEVLGPRHPLPGPASRA